MGNRKFVKIFLSIPAILIMSYYSRVLGVCLILLRYYLNENRRREMLPIVLLVVGFLFRLPDLIYGLSNIINIDSVIISCIDEIVESGFYNSKLSEYGFFLICLGIFTMCISYAMKVTSYKFMGILRRSIQKYEKNNSEIFKQNDMEIKIKQQKAKNTNYVRCPYCGSDNLLSEKHGTCEYCRRTIENVKYKI